MRKSVTVGLISVVLVAAGLIASGLLTTDDESGLQAPRPPVAGPGADRPALDSSGADADVAVLEEPPPGTPGPAAVHPAERQPVSPAAVIEQLPSLARATMLGELDAEALFDAALGAIACVGEQPAARLEDGLATYEFIGPGGALMNLIVPYEDGASGSDLLIVGAFAANPGWATGCVDDGATEASLELHVDLADDGTSAKIASLAHSKIRLTPTLYDALVDLDRPAVRDGMLTFGADGSSWRQATIEPLPPEDGEPGWYSTFTEPQRLDLAYDAARGRQLAQGVSALRQLNRSAAER